MGRNSIYNLLAVSWRHLFTVSAATEESLRKRPFHPKPTLSLTSCLLLLHPSRLFFSKTNTKQSFSFLQTREEFFLARNRILWRKICLLRSLSSSPHTLTQIRLNWIFTHFNSVEHFAHFLISNSSPNKIFHQRISHSIRSLDMV